MTFSNPAYGPGTFVRCDVCRDPEALQTPRPDSELILVPNRGEVVGTDEATESAIRLKGFVRRGWRILCSGCAAGTSEGLARSLFAELRRTGDWCQSVGVGAERGVPILIAYSTRILGTRDLPPARWQGLTVRVRVVGEVRPARWVAAVVPGVCGGSDPSARCSRGAGGAERAGARVDDALLAAAQSQRLTERATVLHQRAVEMGAGSHGL